MENVVAHGTLSGYTNGRCRCEFCREAHADYMRAWRAAKNELLLRGLVNVEHGRDSTYHNWLCRCGACTEAHAQHEPEIAARKRWKLKVVIYRRAALHYGEIEEAVPDWTPQFLQPQCPNCTTHLLPVEALSDAVVEVSDGKTALKLADVEDTARWTWDEWMCPHCLDGVKFDWPPEKMAELLVEARKHVPSYLMSELEFNYKGLYVALAGTDVVAAADEPRKAMRDAQVAVDTVVYVPDQGYPVVAPVDVMAAFFKLEQRCPECGHPVLNEEFTALFTITRSCPNCKYKDLWRVHVDSE